MQEIEITRIEPRSSRVASELTDIWRHRELLYFLTWRDLKVHYKQTALGAAWAVIQPLFMMIVFSIFFGRLARAEPLRIFGDGRQPRDYVYVGDVVAATVAAQGHAGVFNVGTGKETSVLELAAACQRVAGTEVDIHHEAARAGELQRSVLNPGLAERELGFRNNPWGPQPDPYERANRAIQPPWFLGPRY